jgi:hypothetical protein
MRITSCMCFEVMSTSFDCAGFPKKGIHHHLAEWVPVLSGMEQRERMGSTLCTSRGGHSQHVNKPWKWYSTSPFICCAMDIKVLPLFMTKRVVRFKVLGGESALWYLRSEVPTWRPRPTLSFCAWLGLR